MRDYSRGMRQKIGVIQALQHDPELAILDEPTEGLDPLMQLAFYEVLEDLQAAGRTIFMSSHYLGEVERICNRVAIIRAGHLMAVQHVDELLARRKRRVEPPLARQRSRPVRRSPASPMWSPPGDRITATLSGDVAPFVRAVASPSLVDLLIEPARLEEVFFEYYAGEDRARRVGVSLRVLRQSLYWQRGRLIAVGLAGAGLGRPDPDLLRDLPGPVRGPPRGASRRTC